MRASEIAAAMVSCSLLGAEGLAAPSLPPGFTAEEIAPGAGWASPAGLAFAPDGRLFIIEKRGVAWIVEDGVRSAAPFLDLEEEVLDHGDRGLLAVAIDPAFRSNKLVYLLYTVDTGSDDAGPTFGRLTRYQESSSFPGTADPATRKVLLGATWHDGIPAISPSQGPGSLHFGSDRSLLVSAGDAARASGVDAGGLDPAAFGPGRFPAAEDIGAFRAQWIRSLAGKIVRIDPTTGGGLPSNPYYTGNRYDNASRVWVYGLRNPLCFAVRPGTGASDPAEGRPGTVYIGDAGWSTWEEISISLGRGGENFGWPCKEGFDAVDEYAGLPSPRGCASVGTPENPAQPRDPVIEWHHAAPELSTPPGITGRAVSGLLFYEGTTYPAAYRGACFLADQEEGWIKAAVFDSSNGLSGLLAFADGAGGPIDLSSEPVTRDIVYVSRDANEIVRIRYDGSNSPPVARALAMPVSGPAPLTVQFSSAGARDPDEDPLTYLWAFGDGETSALEYPSHTYYFPGAYTATLTVSDLHDARDEVSIEISVQGEGEPNEPPVARILSPETDGKYEPQQELFLHASATDAESASTDLRFSWWIGLHDEMWTNPVLLEGAEASFVPVDHGAGSGTLLEVILTVTDPEGLADSTKAFVFPRAVPIIVEDGDPGTSFTGRWNTSMAPLPHGASSLFASEAGDAYYYSVPLPLPGEHAVYAWWTVLPSRSQAVAYTVRHAGGSSTLFVDQRDGASRWNRLGTFVFADTAEIDITTPGDGSACADAVCILRVPEPNAPPIAWIEDIFPSPAAAGEAVSLWGGAADDGWIAAYLWSSNIDGVIGDQARFATSTLSPGLHTLFFSAVDDQGISSFPTRAVLEVTEGPALHVIVDDGSPATSSSGDWKGSNGLSPWGGGSLYSKKAGSTYVFGPALPARGVYDVEAWWTSFPTRTAAAPISVEYDEGRHDLAVNQQLRGGRWNPLGTYRFRSGARIQLTSAGGGTSTCADAVRLIHRPHDILIDDGDPGTTPRGTWSPSQAISPYGAGSVFAQRTAGTYVYTFSVPEAASYEVLAWWTATPRRSHAVSYTVFHAGGTSLISVNQSEQGGRWNSLGSFAFDSNGLVQVEALADGASYCADAILLRKP